MQKQKKTTEPYKPTNKLIKDPFAFELIIDDLCDGKWRLVNRISERRTL